MGDDFLGLQRMPLPSYAPHVPCRTRLTMASWKCRSRMCRNLVSADACKQYPRGRANCDDAQERASGEAAWCRRGPNHRDASRAVSDPQLAMRHVLESSWTDRLPKPLVADIRIDVFTFVAGGTRSTRGFVHSRHRHPSPYAGAGNGRAGAQFHLIGRLVSIIRAPCLSRRPTCSRDVPLFGSSPVAQCLNVWL